MLQQGYDGTKMDDALGAIYKGEAISRNRESEELNLVEQMQQNKKRDQDYSFAEQDNPLKLEEHRLKNTGQGIQNETGQFEINTKKRDDEMGASKRVAEQAATIAAEIAGLPPELQWAAAKQRYEATPEGRQFWAKMEQAKAGNMIPVGQDGSVMGTSQILEQMAHKTTEMSKKWMLDQAQQEAKLRATELVQSETSKRYANRDASNERIAQIRADAMIQAKQMQESVAKTGKFQNMTPSQLYTYYFRMSQDHPNSDTREHATVLALKAAEMALKLSPQGQSAPRIDEQPGKKPKVVQAPKVDPNSLPGIPPPPLGVGGNQPPVGPPAPGVGPPGGTYVPPKIERTPNGRGAIATPQPRKHDDPSIKRFTSKEALGAANLESGTPFYYGDLKLYVWPDGTYQPHPPPKKK